LPSVAEEDDRRLHRERRRLIAERIQHVNRIKGLCAIHGIYDYQPMRSDRTRRPEQLRTGSGWASLPNMRGLRNCLKRRENDLALGACLDNRRILLA
jgi:transposase